MTKQNPLSAVIMIALSSMTVVFAGCSQVPQAETNIGTSKAPIIESISPEIKKAEVLDYHLGYESDTKLSRFIALVRNPNEAQTLEGVTLNMVALDKDGVVLESSDYIIQRLAPQEKWVVEIRQIRGKAITAEMSISEAENTSNVELEQSFSGDSFSKVKTKIGSLVITSTGILETPLGGQSDSVSICAAFIDKTGDLVGGMCGSQNIVEGRKNAFEVFDYAPRTRPTEILFFAQYR